VIKWALVAFFLITIFATSCFNYEPKLFLPIINKGIILVPSESNFTASHIFLDKASKDSFVLKRFLDERGLPEALSLKNSRKSFVLEMYYPYEREMYIAESGFIDHSLKSEWLIRGPLQIDKNSYRTLVKRMSTLYQNAKIVYSQTPTPVPTPTARIIIKKVFIQPKKTSLATPIPSTEFSTYDQQVLFEHSSGVKGTSPTSTGTPYVQETKTSVAPLLSAPPTIVAKTTAKRSEIEKDPSSKKENDTIHTITSFTENLEQISKKYTGGITHLEDIAQYNTIDTGTSLVLGQKIKIPAKFISK
jgi:hypothetical protein